MTGQKNIWRNGQNALNVLQSDESMVFILNCTLDSCAFMYIDFILLLCKVVKSSVSVIFSGLTF